MKVDVRNLAYWLLSGALLLALLIYGRPFLIPLVFALIVWAVLNALADFLRRFHLTRWLAWPAAFALIAAGFYFVAVVLANEATALSQQWPVYADKLQHLWSAHGFSRYVPAAQDVGTFLKDTGAGAIAASLVASVGATFVNFGLVVIYVGFLLAEQRYLPAKLAEFRKSAAGAESEALVREIGLQIESYLGISTFIGVAMAASGYVVLRILGVDFAGLWALLIFLLNYIPTVGTLGVVFPALLALAQFGAPGPALVILFVLGPIHFVLNNIVGPVMLGRSLDLSPFTVIVSLTFWGTIWGIGGLFLSVPLTGAAVIVCRHIEGLEWIGNLLAGTRAAPRR